MMMMMMKKQGRFFDEETEQGFDEMKPKRDFIYFMRNRGDDFFFSFFFSFFFLSLGERRTKRRSLIFKSFLLFVCLVSFYFIFLCIFPFFFCYYK